MINELEIKELLQLSKNKPHKSLLILIAGGAASGKSTLVDEIKNFFKQSCQEEIVTLSTDYYFLKRRSDHNREPTFFRNLSSNLKELVNWEELNNDLESLLLGDSIYLPTYDPNNDLQFTRTNISVNSSPIVIVEGVFALLEEKIRKKSNLKLYIEVDDDLRLVRRLKRYIAELKEGKVSLPVEYELERYELYVKENHETHTKPTKKYADLVINNNNFEGNLEKIIQAIKEKLSQQLELETRIQKV